MNNPYLMFYETKSSKVEKSQLGTLDLEKYTYIYEDKNYYHLNKDIYIGKIDLKERFAFLLQETSDLYIDLDDTLGAMHGDIVLAKKNIYGEAEVVLVIKRALTKLVAQISIKKDRKLKLVSEVNYHRQIMLEGIENQLVSGHVVLLDVMRITNNSIFTKLNKIIGHMDQPDIETLKIVHLHGWRTEFNDDIYHELKMIDKNVEIERENRIDLTDLFTVTIDGADAKDLDDAISLYEKEGNYHVGVHIADVSHYVKAGSEIDKEAYLRGTSLYLADRVIPMLPQMLSNDLCSLNPDEDKLAISCLMTVTKAGEVIHHQIVPSIIKTNYRLTYDRVNALINENQLFEDEKLNDMIMDFESLSQTLTKIRRKRGALEFDSKEIKFVVDEKGRPLNVILRESGAGEKLIESMMLLANETVAKHVKDAKLPGIYRIHETPDFEKVNDAITQLKKMGISASSKSSINAKTLQILLDKSADTTFSLVAHMILLRSMKKAKYFEEPLGHFGLGAKDYTHFTSPIRRYSDLFLHRILRALVFDKQNFQKQKKAIERILANTCKQASETEREALSIEREVNQLKSCEYMLDKIGKKYEGTITTFLKSGMFVSLDNGIEGFVSLRSFHDFLNYDENLLAFVGKKSEYRMGQKVAIKVLSVDMHDHHIDFEVIEKKAGGKRW